MSVNNEILKFKELSHCWDGVDAEPIAPNAINNALEFIKGYSGSLKFEVFPDPDGSVGLQTEINSGRILISFLKDDTISFFIRIGEKIHRGSEVSRIFLYELLSE